MADKDNILKPSANFSAIPENVVLEIFRHLPVKDLCTIGRVCRSWRRVARDNSLWRHVNLLPYKINLRQVWKVIRAHFSEALISLHLRGFMDKSGVSWSKKSLSDAMLRDLKDRCPNLRTIELVCFCLNTVPSQPYHLARPETEKIPSSEVNLSNFPQQIQEIIITQSFIPRNWFAPMAQDGAFPQLKLLDLSYSTKTNDVDLQHISSVTSLTTLKLAGCYRISDKGVQTLSKALTRLQVLDLSESTRITDVALHHIARNLNNLKDLNLSGCVLITNSGVQTIRTCLVNLENLVSDGCPNLTSTEK